MADAKDRSFKPRAGDRGQRVPPSVDLTKLGQRDNPQEDWGESPDAGVQHGANHTVRPERTEVERRQGHKTRQANKDIVSRRL